MNTAVFVILASVFLEYGDLQEKPPPKPPQAPEQEASPVQTEAPPPLPPPPPPGLLPLAPISEIDTAGTPLGPPLFHEGALIVASQDGAVEAFLAETGEFLWKLGFPEEELLSPRPMADRVLLSLRSGTLIIAAPANGEILQELGTPSPIDIPPLPDGNVFFLASPEGVITAYDSQSEQVIWETPTNEQASSLAKGGDLLMVSGNEMTLTAIDTKNGQIRWTIRGRGGFKAPVVFDTKAERLYVGDLAGTFYAVSAKNGKVNYRWETGGSIASPVLLEGKTVYVVSYANTLFAYRTGNGHELWRINLPGRPASGPVRAGVRLVVATYDGHVVEIDPTQGRRSTQPYTAPDSIRAHPSFSPPHAALTLYRGRILLLSTEQPVPEPPPVELEGPPRPPPKKDTETPKRRPPHH